MRRGEQVGAFLYLRQTGVRNEINALTSHSVGMLMDSGFGISVSINKQDATDACESGVQ